MSHAHRPAGEAGATPACQPNSEGQLIPGCGTGPAGRLRFVAGQLIEIAQSLASRRSRPKQPTRGTRRQ